MNSVPEVSLLRSASTERSTYAHRFEPNVVKERATGRGRTDDRSDIQPPALERFRCGLNNLRARLRLFKAPSTARDAFEVVPEPSLALSTSGLFARPCGLDVRPNRPCGYIPPSRSKAAELAEGITLAVALSGGRLWT